MRVSSLIICPTLASLIDMHALADTVRLLELADKKGSAVVVVNRVPENKAEETIEQAAAAVAGAGVKVAPVYVCDRPQFAAAIQKGKGVTESRTKTKAADEIRELWTYLDKLSNKLAKTTKEPAE
jgi:chromosome partitioning protein